MERFRILKVMPIVYRFLQKDEDEVEDEVENEMITRLRDFEEQISDQVYPTPYHQPKYLSNLSTYLHTK